MCVECPQSSIGINLSLDGVGAEHDDIRGVEGNWDLAMETWRQLKALQTQHANLLLTVHTVVSRFNVHRFKEIAAGLAFLEPDSYITEVAEERVELDTVGWGITPRPEDYDEIADFLSQQARQSRLWHRRFTQAFRAVLPVRQARAAQRPGYPCYAGWPAHLASNGDLWSCCIRAEPAGSLATTAMTSCPYGKRGGGCAAASSARRPARWRTQLRQHAAHPPTVAKVVRDVLK